MGIFILYFSVNRGVDDLTNRLCHDRKSGTIKTSGLDDGRMDVNYREYGKCDFKFLVGYG